jgi:hypothetical protein
VIASTVTHATIEELLEAIFSVGSARGYVLEPNWNFEEIASEKALRVTVNAVIYRS